MLCAILLLIDIASASVQGEVVMKIDSRRAQIRLSGTDLKEGDPIRLYSQECRGAKVQICRKTQVGSGVISHRLTKESSEILTTEGSELREGLVVEKR